MRGKREREETAALTRPARDERAAGAREAAERAPAAAPQRAVVERVGPQIDCGRHPVKRTRGDTVAVEADVLADGHDALAAVVRYRHAGDAAWREVPMVPAGNDLWTGAFVVERLGTYEYTVEAWIDRFASWRGELEKKVAAGHDVRSELLEGAALVRAAAGRAPEPGRAWLGACAERLADPADARAAVDAALDAELALQMGRLADRSDAARYDRVLRVWVDRERARVGAWYEFFPRSAGRDPIRGATLREAAARLPAIAAMGFDVVYLPPIHPIGRTHRKGRNNALTAGPDDPGSPWAIGNAAGGHTAVDPALGTLEDFDRFVAGARGHGLEVALDIAFQCSPDHPWVREHPEWFRHRPDGTIKYAENPPKRYEDIYPFDFEGAAWRALWEALRDVIVFWIGHGVAIFRVDNPHTKPLPFWEWLIATIQRAHPEVLFLSEAFTRPKVMRALAKAGFTQSYTYFTWRNTKAELTEYFTELTGTAVREYLRPNLFANTPDILHEYLQFGGRAAFQIRLVLAATLGASYGIYGPPFELCEAAAIPGTEEYQNAEKYEIRVWDHDRPGHIRDFVTRVNAARRANPALHHDHGLRFHDVSNDELLAYSKTSPDGTNLVVVVVNLDPHHPQEGWVTLPLDALGVPVAEVFQVHDVLSDARYLWQGERNYVRLDPHACPAHLFVVRRRTWTERDFDYYV